MFHNITDKECEECLPDCDSTIYSTTVTTSSFRVCNHQNLGASFLCNLDNPDLPDPKIWANQVIQEYQSQYGWLPDYISEQVSYAQTTFSSHWSGIFESRSNPVPGKLEETHRLRFSHLKTTKRPIMKLMTMTLPWSTFTLTHQQPSGIHTMIANSLIKVGSILNVILGTPDWFAWLGSTLSLRLEACSDSAWASASYPWLRLFTGSASASIRSE